MGDGNRVGLGVGGLGRRGALSFMGQVRDDQVQSSICDYFWKLSMFYIGPDIHILDAHCTASSSVHSVQTCTEYYSEVCTCFGWSVLDARRRKTVGKSPWQIDKRPVSVGQLECGILCGEIGVDMRSIRQKMESRIIIEMAQNIGEDRNTVRSNHKILLERTCEPTSSVLVPDWRI